MDHLYFAGQFEDFVSHCGERLDFVRRHVGDCCMAAAITLQDLAAGYHELGDLEKSGACDLQALEIIRYIEGRRSSRYAFGLVLLGNSLRRLDRDDKAESRYCEALHIFDSLPAEERSGLDAALANLAMLRVKHGRFAEAEELLFKAIPVSFKEHGWSSCRTAPIFLFLGQLYRRMDRPRDAQKCVRKAVRTHERTNATKCRRYGCGLMLLGKLSEESGSLADAQRWYSRAADVLLSARPPCKRLLDEANARLAHVTRIGETEI